ncbi:MAG: glycosyl hydrolase family 16, partial [Calditrichaeota bacterium]|nr:glycosyl hydrolase family 16 [Calditrichota bacterium]
YTNLVFAGIEFTTQTVDASAMSHFHLDIWTPNSTAAPAIFKIKLVDFGADGAFGGGDDVEHELTLDATTTPAIASESWVGLDIPLADFTGLTTTGHLAQLIISGDLSTLYVDNVYFYTSG